MHTHKKYLSLVLALLLALGLLAGCTPTADVSEPEESVAESTADGVTSEETPDASEEDVTESSSDEASTDGSSEVTGDSTTVADAGSTTVGADKNTTTGGGKNTTASTGKGSTTRRTTASTTRRTSRATVTVEGSLTDMKGYNFVFSTIWGGDWIVDEDSSSAVKALKSKYDQVQKELNCKITFKGLIPSTFQAQMAKAYTAGDKFADAMEIAPVHFFNLVRNNYFIPLDESKVINLNDAKWEKSAKAFSTYNGHTYGLSWVSPNVGVPARGTLFYNKTMAAKYGIEDLYKLVDNKQWTFDKYYEVLNTVKSKSGGSVQPLAIWSPAAAGATFAAANGGLMVTEKGGKFSYNGTSKNVVTGMEFANKLFANNLLLDTSKQDFNSVVIKSFSNSKTFSLIVDYYYAHTEFSGNMKDDYGMLPLPMGPDVNNYQGIYGDSRFFTLLDTADRDKSCAILDKLATLTLDTNWKTTALMNDMRDEESLRMVEINMNNPVINIYEQLGELKEGVDGIGEYVDAAVRKGSVASQLQSAANKAQAWLDDHMNEA